MHLRHVGIVCQNIERMLKYWGKLGKVIDDHTEQVRIVKLDNGIELLQYESQSENNLRKAGISHIAFTADPEENFLEVINEHGRRKKILAT